MTGMLAYLSNDLTSNVATMTKCLVLNREPTYTTWVLQMSHVNLTESLDYCGVFEIRPYGSSRGKS